MKPIQPLLLASKSQSRQFLLKEITIPFTIIAQDADESRCDWGLSLQQLVESIARYKMEHAVVPDGERDGAISFILTADTLSQDADGQIHGKPTDREDAIEKIKKARNGSRLCTSFCLDRRVWRNNAWVVEKRIQKSVHAEYLFIIPDDWIETYLSQSIALSVSNAIAIEGFGAQFLKVVNGSYSTIVGLPLFELRESLEEIGYFVP